MRPHSGCKHQRDHQSIKYNKSVTMENSRKRICSPDIHILCRQPFKCISNVSNTENISYGQKDITSDCCLLKWHMDGRAPQSVGSFSAPLLWMRKCLASSATGRPEEGDLISQPARLWTQQALLTVQQERGGRFSLLPVTD